MADFPQASQFRKSQFGFGLSMLLDTREEARCPALQLHHVALDFGEWNGFAPGQDYASDECARSLFQRSLGLSKEMRA